MSIYFRKKMNNAYGPTGYISSEDVIKLKSGKNIPTSFVFDEETKILIKKLAKIHDRSQAGILKFLVKKEAKEYGLIESRD